MALGKKILELRLAKNWSQEQLSAKTNWVVSQGAISTLEKRDSKSSRFTSVLAEALGVSVNELLSEKPYVKSNRLEQLHKVAEKLPDYAIDKLIQDALNTAEFIEKARELESKNGTEK